MLLKHAMINKCKFPWFFDTIIGGGWFFSLLLGWLMMGDISTYGQWASLKYFSTALQSTAWFASEKTRYTSTFWWQYSSSGQKTPPAAELQPVVDQMHKNLVKWAQCGFQCTFASLSQASKCIWYVLTLTWKFRPPTTKLQRILAGLVGFGNDKS